MSVGDVGTARIYVEVVGAEQALASVRGLQTQYQQLSTTLDSSVLQKGGKTAQGLEDMSIANINLSKTAEGLTRNYTQLGMGLAKVTTAGVSLTMQYSAIWKSQVALERANLMLNVSTNALGDAQRRYNTALEKYGLDSELTQAALADLRTAEERVQVQTDRLGLAQERVNEMMLIFGATILPTTLTMINGVRDAIRGLGLSTSALSSMWAGPLIAAGVGAIAILGTYISNILKAQEAERALAQTVLDNARARENWAQTSMATAAQEAAAVVAYNQQMAYSYAQVAMAAAAANAQQALALQAEATAMKAFGQVSASPESIAATVARQVAAAGGHPTRRSERRAGRGGVSRPSLVYNPAPLLGGGVPEGVTPGSWVNPSANFPLYPLGETGALRNVLSSMSTQGMMTPGKYEALRLRSMQGGVPSMNLQQGPGALQEWAEQYFGWMPGVNRSGLNAPIIVQIQLDSNAVRDLFKGVVVESSSSGAPSYKKNIRLGR